MRFTLARMTDPDFEPVTLAEILQHVREYSSAPQAAKDELMRLVTAGREWVEDYTGRALISQKWRLSIGNFVNPTTSVPSDSPDRYWIPTADGSIFLYKSPVLAITSFVSVDAAGVETAIAATKYELRDATTKWPRVMPLSGATWTEGPLRVEFSAGYVDDVVPERFKQAIKLWVEANYDRDEKMMKILLDTAERLIKPEMVDISLA